MINIFYGMLFIGVFCCTIFAGKNGQKRKIDENHLMVLPPIENAEALLQAIRDKKVIPYSDTQIFANSGEFGTITKGKKIIFKKIDMKPSEKSSCGCCAIQ